jgi:hypothetical protein
MLGSIASPNERIVGISGYRSEVVLVIRPIAGLCYVDCEGRVGSRTVLLSIRLLLNTFIMKREAITG